MKKQPAIILVVLSLLALLAGCGKKPVPAEVAAIVGSDTITVAVTKQLRPDSLSDSLRTEKVVAQRALSKRCRTTLSGAPRDTMLNALMQQLSLRSGVEWNRDAAGSLFDAVCGLRALLDTAKTIEKVTAFLDSALGAGRLGNGGTISMAGVASCRGTKGAAEIRFDSLISCVLGVSPEVGRTLEQFLLSSNRGPEDAAKTTSMIKGLLADKNAPVKNVQTTASEPVDNSEAVLKFRSLESIKDSIDRHQPDIRELYKRHLKKDGRMAGKVAVQFRVAAGGEVLSTAIVSSTIADKLFLEGLAAYAKTIRFKPVPARAGAMRFEFPFEFTPEE